ncbi:outer membrane protein assembly factor BamA [Malaciobacter sp. WC5094]
MKNKAVLFSLACATALCANTIKSIEYKNLNKISPKIVNETLGFKTGDKLDNEKLNNAIKKFYDFGYFDDIIVLNNNGNIELVFKEKPSIAKVEIKGYKTREEEIETMKDFMKVKKGVMYTPQRVEDGKKVILDLLESEGYINSVVEIETEKLNENSLKVTYNVNKGDEIIIKKANYYGADKLDGDDFEEVTANNEKEFASWWFGQNSGEVKVDELKYDSRRINELYFENGYLDAQVKKPYLNIDFASNQANLDFFISEGQKYTTNDIKIYVDSTIVDPKYLLENLDLIIGNTFNIKRLRADQEYIRTQVANQGYGFAQVKFDIKKNTEDSTVDVVFNVIPGEKVYINDVKISGNTRTLDRVIRRNVYLAPGDLYSATDLKDSISKLRRTRSFDDVKIEEKRVSENKIDLLVKVVETSTGSLILGGGYGSYDKLMINASVSDSSIFGSGIGVGVNADLSAKKSKFSFNIKNPAINDSEYNGEFEIHNSEDEITRDTYDLDKNSLGFSVSVGKEVIRDMYVGLRYRLDSIEEDYQYKDSSKNNNPTYYQDDEYITSSITPYLNFDNTDDFYVPREGYKMSSSLEFAGVGGDSQYLKSTTSFKYFQSIEDLTELDWIFRFRTQMKVLGDLGQLNPGDSLYMGGPRSLRGYKSYAFGPSNEEGIKEPPYKRLWTNSLELNFPLSKSAKMRWGVFYDYGMTGVDDFSDVKRSSTGALLEWISPVGPLQLIFAQPLDDEAGDETSSFEFSLGASF